MAADKDTGAKRDVAQLETQALDALERLEAGKEQGTSAFCHPPGCARSPRSMARADHCNDH